MTTIVFPGQGSQFIGMSKDFYDNFNVSKETFEIIEDSTKINLKKIIFENDKDLLNITQYTQISIFCASMAIFNVLKNLLNEKGISFHCSIIGNEGDVSKKQVNDDILNKGLNSKVEYIGTKYGDEKLEFFEKADIFVFPTYYENECFPLVLLEAMQFRIPVVTTNEGAIEEIIEHNKNGYIVEKKNPSSLAEKIEDLIGNEATRISFGEAGYKKYYENYTVEAFENRLISIFNNYVN